MSEKLLSQAEQEALLEIFKTPRTVEQKVKSRSEEALGAGKEETGRSSVLESEARRWAEALKKKCETDVSVTLHKIVKHAKIAMDAEEHCYRMSAYPNRYLVCTADLINLVNERALGSREAIPLVTHTLTEIDKALFESSGAIFDGGDALTYLETPPQANRWLEARFDVRVAPILRTTLRLLVDA